MYWPFNFKKYAKPSFFMISWIYMFEMTADGPDVFLEIRQNLGGFITGFWSGLRGLVAKTNGISRPHHSRNSSDWDLRFLFGLQWILKSIYSLIAFQVCQFMFPISFCWNSVVPDWENLKSGASTEPMNSIFEVQRSCLCYYFPKSLHPKNFQEDLHLPNTRKPIRAES